MILERFFYCNNSGIVFSRTCARCTNSISVTNRFPHSMRWMAFLSMSSPESCKAFSDEDREKIAWKNMAKIVK